MRASPRSGRRPIAPRAAPSQRLREAACRACRRGGSRRARRISGTRAGRRVSADRAGAGAKAADRRAGTDASGSAFSDGRSADSRVSVRPQPRDVSRYCRRPSAARRCASVRRSRASGVSVRPQSRYFPRHSRRPAGPADIGAARPSLLGARYPPVSPLAPPRHALRRPHRSGCRPVGGGAESGAGGASRRTAAGSCHDTGPRPAVRDAALWVRQSRLAAAIAAAEPGRSFRGAERARRREGLRRCVPAALPVQAYDLRAPCDPDSAGGIGIRRGIPTIPRNTPASGIITAERVWTICRGMSAVSVDTVRLQGQLSGGLDYLKYTRANDRGPAEWQSAGLRFGDGGAGSRLYRRPRRDDADFAQLGGLGFAGPESHPDIGSDAADHNLPDPDCSVSLSADTSMANCVIITA